MHALGLIDLAATFVRHAEAQIALKGKPSVDAMHGYWLASRYRHDEWSTRLANHRTELQKVGASTRKRLWYELLPVMQEILLAEPLVRCVAHQAAVLEETKTETDFAPLAQSVFTAQMEVRQRCLHMLVFGHGLSTEHAVRLNRIRKKTEDLSDQLLASLRPLKTDDIYSLDPLLTCAIRNKLSAASSSDVCRRLHTAGLSHWFVRCTALDIDYRNADARHNGRIAQTVLGLMPRTVFDDFGVPMTHHMAPYLSASFDHSPTDSEHSPGAGTHTYSSPLDVMTPTRSLSSTVSPRRW